MTAKKYFNSYLVSTYRLFDWPTIVKYWLSWFSNYI